MSYWGYFGHVVLWTATVVAFCLLVNTVAHAITYGKVSDGQKLAAKVSVVALVFLIAGLLRVYL